MKTVFDKSAREEIIRRINTLTEQSRPEWGSMNVYQMLKHCVLCEELYLGKIKHKRTLLGRLFGKTALRNLMKDERPLQRNAPTSSVFKVKEVQGDVQSEKRKWIALMEEYENFSNDNFVHWFFGKMTKDEVGRFVYKHTDHHLRQFGV